MGNVVTRNTISASARGAAAPEPRSRRYRVLVAECSTMFRRGLVGLLSGCGNLEVVGEAADAAQLLEAACRLQPEVVVLDARILGGSDGLSREVLRQVPGVSILTLGSTASVLDTTRSLTGGSSGYVLKESEPELLVAAIVAAAHGYAVSPRLAMREIGRASDTAHRTPDGLSHREFEVLRDLAGGMTTKALAGHLEISEKTVRNHIASMYGKLGVQGRPQLVRYAIRQGLSRPPEGA
jgi:DNA-binding NarL/FixJ family response regulator